MMQVMFSHIVTLCEYTWGPASDGLYIRHGTSLSSTAHLKAGELRLQLLHLGL